MWVIEGEWSGYHSGQRKVVHREYVPKSKAKFAEAVRSLGCIRYTDGTTLRLSVSEVRERRRAHGKPHPINGYGELIRDCVFHKVDSVEALVKARRRLDNAMECGRLAEAAADGWSQMDHSPI